MSPQRGTDMMEDVKGYDNRGEEDSSSGNVDNEKLSFWQRRSVAVANRPCTHLCTSIFAALVLGIGGMILGGFTVTVDGEGWESRGTLISNRQMQFTILQYNEESLYNDIDGSLWQSLIDNKQKNLDSEDDDAGRRLIYSDVLDETPRPFFDSLYSKPSQEQERKLPFVWTEYLDRRLQTAANTSALQGCDTDWYRGEIFDDSRLWPIWRLKANKRSGSFFQAQVFEELCEEEKKTQQYLVDNGLCFGCDSTEKCLPPYSLVLFARLVVENGMAMESCAELAQGWEASRVNIEDDLVQCVIDLKTDYDPERDGQTFPVSCPEGFDPSMLDELYDETTRIRYTSSVFATSSDQIDNLYDAADKYADGTSQVEGAYDTQDEDFVDLSLDAQLGTDMLLALGSAFITTLAMLIHTRSTFLALIGFAQVTLSFPFAYTVYTFLGQLDFFPFLNFIGVFVVFALGADDVFVSVDKWKNARLQKPNAPVQEIAVLALPDAASAMFLTTATTSVAFFGTAICPVAPIKCFAIFVAIMIILDYVLCVLLVFPALVIYDNRLGRSWFFDTKFGCFGRCCSKNTDSDEEANPEENKEAPKSDNDLAGIPEESKDAPQNDTVLGLDPEANFVRRLFSKYYAILHTCRWPLLVICLGAFILTAIGSAAIKLPTSSDVRLYDENDNQYEQNYVWRQSLLYDVLSKKGGSSAFVVWGLKAEDNGDRNNPAKWSSLAVDNSFKPSETESQVFLRDFCDDLFANEFAGLVETSYVCPINRFDSWLGAQSSSISPDAIYEDHCNGATGVPMDVNTFDACISAWAAQEEETSVLSREGKVQALYVTFNSRVRFDSPYADLDKEWKAIEKFMKSLETPPGASKGYFTSEDFWWYDTNGQMLTTAYASSGIAMGAAGAAILFSSRSIILTLFSTLTVGYVLTSVTATLVAMGWTLGFLEAILFAILIGISCDFVIHFSHAYAHAKGDVDRHTRTQFALLSMGPSILAAAITTFFAATCMMFTVITFFEKFGVVLFLTILQAVVGSFVVFLTITDAVGPTHPTYLYEQMVAKWKEWRNQSTDADGPDDDVEA